MTHQYPYIPEGKNIEYVSDKDVFMIEAKQVRNTLSTDLKHPTGAVVVLKGKIIGRGANQSALKNKKLLHLHKKGWCMRRIFKIPSGQKYWLCPGCSSPHHHAEAQVVKNAHTLEVFIKGADLYLYGHWWCCKPCWDSMISAGINIVYLVENATELFK